MRRSASSLIIYNPLAGYHQCVACHFVFKDELKAIAHAELHIKHKSHSIYWNGHTTTWDCTCGKSFLGVGDAAYHQTVARKEDKLGKTTL